MKNKKETLQKMGWKDCKGQRIRDSIVRLYLLVIAAAIHIKKLKVHLCRAPFVFMGLLLPIVQSLFREGMGGGQEVRRQGSNGTVSGRF